MLRDDQFGQKFTRSDRALKRGVRTRTLHNEIGGLDDLKLSTETERHAMRAVRSLMHGCVSLEPVGGFGIAVDVEQSPQFLVTTIVRGVRQRTGESRWS